MGGGGNGCGSGLLVVTSNKLVTFPRWNSIRLSGNGWAHAALSGEWMEQHSPFGWGMDELMLLCLGNGWNSNCLSGPCCSVWGMDGTAFAFQAHAAPFGECNYNLMCSYYMLKMSHKSAMYASCNSNKINKSLNDIPRARIVGTSYKK